MDHYVVDANGNINFSGHGPIIPTPIITDETQNYGIDNDKSNGSSECDDFSILSEPDPENWKIYDDHDITPETSFDQENEGESIIGSGSSPTPSNDFSNDQSDFDDFGKDSPWYIVMHGFMKRLFSKRNMVWVEKLFKVSDEDPRPSEYDVDVVYLDEIKEKFDKCEYRCPQKFAFDINVLFAYYTKHYKPGQPYHDSAQKLLRFFEKETSKKFRVKMVKRPRKRSRASKRKYAVVDEENNNDQSQKTTSDEKATSWNQRNKPVSDPSIWDTLWATAALKKPAKNMNQFPEPPVNQDNDKSFLNNCSDTDSNEEDVVVAQPMPEPTSTKWMKFKLNEAQTKCAEEFGGADDETTENGQNRCLNIHDRVTCNSLGEQLLRVTLPALTPQEEVRRALEKVLLIVFPEDVSFDKFQFTPEQIPIALSCMLNLLYPQSGDLFLS